MCQFRLAARRRSAWALHWVTFVSIGVGLAVPGLAQGPPTINAFFGAASISVGESTTLTFRIKGAGGLTGVGFIDTLPPGLVIASPDGFSGFKPAGACEGGTITAAAGTGTIALSGASFAAPHSSCAFSVNVTATSPGTLNNL